MIYHDMDGWWLIMMVVWGVAAIVVATLVVRALWGIDERSQRPIDIARRRYARGEITREEFERIRQDLFRQ
ncbi:MAG TPA: SHOCT domain-containing protein [Dehalococcoidia bacterium]|nr:SHOCT domain-containing protein [Dehalococcoidia bacterium]